MSRTCCNRKHIPKFQIAGCVRHFQLLLPLLQLDILPTKLVTILKFAIVLFIWG